MAKPVSRARGVLAGLFSFLFVVAFLGACFFKTITLKNELDLLDTQKMQLEEEIEEFTLADGIEKEKEGGDILFSAVNVLRMCGIDPEVALFGTTDRFEKRFRYVIDRAKEEGKEVEELTLEEMEVYYNESKKFYK